MSNVLFIVGLAAISALVVLTQAFLIPDREQGLRMYPVVFASLLFLSALIKPKMAIPSALAVAVPWAVLASLLLEGLHYSIWQIVIITALCSFLGMACGRVGAGLIRAASGKSFKEES